MRFRKKPVVVDAVQWTGTWSKIIDWLDAISGARFPVPIGTRPPIIRKEDCLEIDTLEGVMRADPGDWIICGIKGEFYPCKPDIFSATYEAVEEAS
jgi:hypothetical protein